jgi:hypothetical protein
MRKLKFKVGSNSFLVCLVFVFLSSGHEGSAFGNATMSYEVYLPLVVNSKPVSNLAYNWLASQQDQYKTGLIESYDDLEILRDVCFTYDQAVAAIAFMIKGDTKRTQSILDRLQDLQNSSGSWYTAYHCNNSTVWEWDQHVGPVLWVTLAIAAYEQSIGDTSYHSVATNAINWAMQFQQSDGGINGGINGNGNILTWASTEHNEDAFSVLSHYGYSKEALHVKSFLDDHVWDISQGRWWGGRNDPRDPLDVNAWGVSALGKIGKHNYQDSLNYVMTHHRNVQSNIDGYDFDSDKDDVWLEGTCQMAVAFQVVGRYGESNYFIEEVIKSQDLTGGIPYSINGTWNGYWKMSTKKSVAATGWLIFATEHVNPMRPNTLP